MIFVPFIYFSLLLIYILKAKKRFEISALITSAYITTSFFAILIDYKQLYGEAGCIKADIGLAPTFLYCLLITMTILPFIKLPPLTSDNVIPIKNLKLLNRIVYFYALIFVLFIFFFGKEVINRIQSPDIAALRIAFSNGDNDLVGITKYSGIIRIIVRLVFVFGSSAMFIQVIYFYSLTFLNRSSKFNLWILIFSSMPIIISLLSFDRSKVIYWLMSFIALAVFFWPALNRKSKLKIKRTFIIFLSIFLVYLGVVTIARYGTQNVGAGNSLIVYAGQSFNNFCLFFNQININRINLEKVTPVLNYVLGSSNNIRSSSFYYSTIDTNVFASFSGMMIKYIGVSGSILYSFIFFMLATLIFWKTHKYNITKIFLVVILLYIPYLGIFGIFYGNIERELTVWFILILCYFLNRKVYV